MEKDSCVYYFFNDSVKRRKRHKAIHKVVLNNFYVLNELTNIKKIREHKMNFYVCQNSSELKIMELAEDMNSLNLCKDVKKDDTILLKFEGREIIYLKNYLKDLTNGSSALSSQKKYILTIIEFYKYLLFSIDLLVNHQIVHNNINFNSIVVDNTYPLITDFSLSIDISRIYNGDEQYIKHFIIAYDPSYLEWPLEFHILSYLLTNKLNSLSSYNIENIVCNVIDNHTILKTFGDSIVSSYKQEALNYFKKYVNRSYDYILTDVLQYYYTWDNYALSIMFLRMLIEIHRTIQIKNKFIILFMKLLVCNIHLNPVKRLSISSTTNKFEAILNSLEPKDYKELL
jgi:hypothetical protein